MSVGALNIEVSANFARFQSDIGKVVATAEASAKRMDQVFGVVATSLKALGAGFAIGLTLDKIKDKIEGAIASAAGLQELAERTGSTVESLSGLAAVAKLSGTDTDALATGLQKLSKALVDAKDGGQKTGAAFEAIGISTKQLIGLKPDEAFLLISNRLATYADGAEKVALAQALLGKAGANLLPVMKDLADVGEYQVKTTAAQAEQSLEFEKNLKRLEAAQNALFKTVALEVVPVLNAFAKALVESATRTDGLKGTVQELAKDGSIRAWAEDAIKVVGFVIDAFDGVSRVVLIVNKTIGAAAAQAVLLAKGEFSQAAQVGRELGADVEAILQKTLFSERLQKQLDAARKPAEEKAARPQINFKPNTGGPAGDDPAKKLLEGQLKALDAYIASEKTLLATREQNIEFYKGLEFVTLRQAETLRQQLIADTLAKEKEAYDKEAALLVLRIASAQKEVDKQEARNKLDEVNKKRAAAEIEANKQIGESEQRLFAIQRQFDLATIERDRQAKLANDAAEFQISLLGKNTLEVQKLTQARQIDLVTAERIRLLQKQDPTADVSEAIAAAEREKAAALALTEEAYNKQRDAAFGAQEAFRKYAEEATDAATQTESLVNKGIGALEDSLTNLLSGQKFSFHSLVDSLIQEIIRLSIVKPLLADIFGTNGLNGSAQQGFSGILGSIGKVFGFGSSLSSGATGGLGINAAGAGFSAAADTGLVGDAASAFVDFGAFLADGTNYVPYDGMKAILHKGEAVVPAVYNPDASGTKAAQAQKPTQTIAITVNPPSGMTGAAATQVGANIARQLALADRRNN